MATPLTATYRLHIPYISQGRAHVQHQYVRIATLTPTITLRARDGVTETLWTDVVDGIVPGIAETLPAGSSFGAVTLENLAGVVWNPIASYTAAAPVVAGTAFPATQLTVVMRTTTFKKIRLQVMDLKYAAPGHWIDRTLAPGGVVGYLSRYDGLVASGTDAWFYAVGRDNSYLQTSPFAGITIDLNDKLRRAAGLT
jgi:hypothetical protein